MNRSAGTKGIRLSGGANTVAAQATTTNAHLGFLMRPDLVVALADAAAPAVWVITSTPRAYLGGQAVTQLSVARCSRLCIAYQVDA